MRTHERTNAHRHRRAHARARTRTRGYTHRCVHRLTVNKDVGALLVPYVDVISARDPPAITQTHGQTLPQ